jgi:hypothetical protein
MRRFYLSLTLVLLTSGACITSGGATRSGGDPDRVTAGELAPLQTFTAYQAVRRLRPAWLTVRGNAPAPVILVDGVRMGGPDVLNDFRASDLVEMRHRSGPDATTLYGTGHGGGTIELRTRVP